MAARFLHCSLPVLWGIKRRRTEPPPSPILSQDEEDCILGLLMLSRAPLVLHGGVRPLSAPKQQPVLLPRSSPPETTGKGEPYPISFPGITPLLPPAPPEQRPSPPTQKQQDLPLPPPPLPEQEQSPLLSPALKQQWPNEPLLSLPPPEQHPSPPAQKQRDQQLLPPPPTPEKERSLLLSPALKQQPQNEPLLPLPKPEKHPSPPAPKKQDQQLLLSSPALKQQRQKEPVPPPTPSTDDLLRYECSECGKAFSSFRALGGHKSSHYRKRPSPSPLPEKQRRVKARRSLAMPSTSLTERSPKKGQRIDLNQPLMETD